MNETRCESGETPHDLERAAADRAVIDAAKAWRAEWDDIEVRSTLTCDHTLIAAVDALESTPDPNEHPEKTCTRCSGPNIAWTAPSPLWNEVIRGGDINGDEIHRGIVCPTCFAILAEKTGIAEFWRLSAERVHRPLKLVTPSGRVWNEQTWMWDGPEPDLPPCKTCGDTGMQQILTLGGRHSGQITEVTCPSCSALVRMRGGGGQSPMDDDALTIDWRDFTIENDGHGGVFVLCRSTGRHQDCEWVERNPDGRYLTLGEAVNAAQKHVAWHAQMAALDAPPAEDQKDERPSAYLLWVQANGDRAEYIRLMKEHGHLIARQPGDDSW